MPVCKICKTTNDNKNIYCKYCGSYLKLSIAQKILICAIICLILSCKFIILLLLALILIITAIILLIKDCIKINKIRKQNNVNISELLKQNYIDITQKTNMSAPEKFKATIQTLNDNKLIYQTYFVKNNSHKPRKNDGNIIKGDCIIEICNTDNSILIIQENQVIRNYITSIYYFDIWHYKDETYYKIVMRSHNEYTFKNIDDEVDELKTILNYRDVKIEDNR